MYVGGGTAKLTFPHLNKDDEGLYTLRIWTKEGTTEHSAYLFVKGLLQKCTFLFCWFDITNSTVSKSKEHVVIQVCYYFSQLYTRYKIAKLISLQKIF